MMKEILKKQKEILESKNTRSIRELYDIDIQGFGVGIAPESYLKKLNLTGLDGYDNETSQNYGNYVDSQGNIFVFIPKFYYKIESNDFYLSSQKRKGYVIHRAFINSGKEIDGFFIGKYSFGDGNVKSLKSKQPYSFITINTALQKIKALNSNYTISNAFMYSAIAMISKFQQQFFTKDFCSYVDNICKFPKGNNVSGVDNFDKSVSFTRYAQLTLTGSGVPFSKTTHNGQDSGVADINGNVWEFSIGLTCFNNSFYYLNEDVDLNTLDNSNFMDLKNYTKFDYKVSASQGNFVGNGNNQVFGFSNDRNSREYILTSCGLPLESGISTKGSWNYGNNKIFNVDKKVNNLIMLVGGNFSNGGYAGVWCRNLGYSNTISHLGISGRLAIIP